MRYTVTPLGGAKRSVRQIAAQIADYLIPKDPPSPSEAPGTAGPARYYADGGDQPGRWRGRGAARLQLVGEVDPTEFAVVLAGRDPRTGERLIGARGSAGRRPRLGVGSETRWNGTGEALYDARDAAAALGVDVTDVDAMIDAGTRLAMAHLLDTTTGTLGRRVPGEPHPQPGKARRRSGKPGTRAGTVPDIPAGSYLVPVIDSDGNQWVTDTELTRCEDARSAGIDADALSAAGAPGDLLPLADAARLVGVTPRYLRKLATRYERDWTLIDAMTTAGQQPHQAWLVAHRGPDKRWFVKRSDLADFVRRRQPPAVRVGFDLTLTTEKSLSVLALLADPAVGRIVLDAIADANDVALDWLENHTAATRIQGRTVPVEGWAVATFRHLTSRALDPFAHWHNVLPNTVESPDGARRALDARGLYRDAKAASALATAQARCRITHALGVRWRPARHGGWEIAGLDDELLTEFSQRRTEVDDALRELEEAIGRSARPDEVEQIVLRTRPAKEHAAVDELRARWWARAANHGLTPGDLADCLRRPAPLAEPDTRWLHQRLAAPEGGVCQNLSVFGYGDLLAALCDLPVPHPDGSDPQPLLVPAKRLEDLARGFLRSPHVVQLTSGDNPTWTTREILDVQRRIVARFTGGLGQGAASVAPADIETALAAHLHLTTEQRRLVHQFCGSGHRTQCALGHPGAGKTTAMAAARDAWTAAGWRVVGAAVKGEAARTLGDATGIPTETLAWWLAHTDPHTVPLDARTVLIVDEASTISDRDLDQLCWLCHQTGTVLRLIGDPDQHGAVESGGMFRVLCEHHPQHTPSLTHTHRVRDPHDRAAAEALRHGDIGRALDHLEAAGHLHIVDQELDFYRQVLGRWWDAYQAGHHHPMVDSRNSVRHRLNRLAHRLLQAAGHVGADDITATGDRRFAIGDDVIARTPARHHHPPGCPDAYVRNGATGKVIGLHHGRQPGDDTITVDFDGIGTITLPRSFFDEQETAPGRVDVGLDHAYAVTSYAVQGSTHPVSTSRIDQRSTRAEMLVDITRGRTANHLYLARSAGQLDDEPLPRTPEPPIDQAVIAKLGRAKGEVTAWEIMHADAEPSVHPLAPTAALGL
ncbi:MAG: MobF family relaxase [Acidimicrobiales bacterium]